jgi:hypothetical protein
MNPQQRIVLTIGGLIIGLMTLFPPWIFSFSYFGPPMYQPELQERPAGYHLVFGSHVPTDQTELERLFGVEPIPLSRVTTRIDRGRLATQIVGGLFVTILLCLALSSRSAKTR